LHSELENNNDLDYIREEYCKLEYEHKKLIVKITNLELIIFTSKIKKRRKTAKSFAFPKPSIFSLLIPTCKWKTQQTGIAT
jgi:hypothetical protein